MNADNLALPEPPVPADADLRHFPSMQIDVRAVRDGQLAPIQDAQAFTVTMLAYCVAWHQLPAGSLPDDDLMLARLLSSSLARWRRLRPLVLAGWKKCRDGRLYHPELAEKVRRAADLSRRQSSNARAPNARQILDRQANQGSHGLATRQTGGEAVALPGKGVEKEKTSSSSLRSDDELPAAPRASRAAPAERGTRLLADWWPDPNQRAFAAELGLDVDWVAEQFRDHWLARSGRDATKQNWQAAWQYWCRNEAKFAARRGGWPRAAARDARRTDASFREDIFGRQCSDEPIGPIIEMVTEG